MRKLSSAIVLLMGFTPSAFSAVIPDGKYQIQIQPTPVYTTSYGGTNYKFGKAGSWNSNFSFGVMPGNSSIPLTDNDDVIVNWNGISFGSSIPGDGLAGVININVVGSRFTVSTFNVDTYSPAAWWSNFSQWSWTVSSMSGSINQTNGSINFTPTGRLGIVDTQLIGRFGVVPGATAWKAFTTGTASNPLGSITGNPITPIGDVNGDGRQDFQATLVSGSQANDDGGPEHFSTFEVWKVKIISQ